MNPDSTALLPFLKGLGITATDPNLFLQVFVHRSFLNEHRTFPFGHNERLEFLGDAVLELVTTEFLYRTYPNPEGELTNWRSALVKGEMLAHVASELGLEPHLLLSRGEKQSTGKARQLILANAFEALLGALYLDQGYQATQSFLAEHLLNRLETVLKDRLYIDAKSDLQERTQDRLGMTPTYSLLESSGPDHEKQFVVGVYVNDRLVAQGSGRSKQKAEQAAATEALKQDAPLRDDSSRSSS
ncbi:ribonuclease III [Candidatus Berkelbacteria bacterium]|nr:ribonuclease III [Candidatus Berkelbacteria bacterium]